MGTNRHARVAEAALEAEETSAEAGRIVNEVQQTAGEVCADAVARLAEVRLIGHRAPTTPARCLDRR